jgi:hypothetical protein
MLFQSYSGNPWIDAQQLHALDGIEIMLGGASKKVNRKVLVAFIIGDMQGGDKMMHLSSMLY